MNIRTAGRSGDRESASLRGLIVVGALLIAMLWLQPNAFAAAPALPKITSASPAKVRGGGQVVVDVAAKAGKLCRVRITLSGHGSLSSSKRVTKSGVVQFVWNIPKKTPTGTVKFTASSTGTKRTSVRTIRIVGTPHRGKIAGRLTAITIHSVEPPTAVSGLGGAAYPAYGSVMVHGSAWFGGQGVDVMSNGAPGNDNGAWQCVELVNRFIQAKGFYAGSISGNADQIYANALRTGAFDQHPNGSGYIPAPGDIVCEGGGSYGHVAIVDYVGGGLVFIVEQNASSSGRNALSLGGSTLQPEYGMPVIGVLHAKANRTTNPPVPGARAGEAQYVVATADGHLWHTIRRPNGTWDVLGNLRTELGITSTPTVLAAAGDGVVGEAQYVVATADGHLWHTIRRPNGTWDVLGNLRTELGITSTPTVLAAAGDGVVGEAQFAIATADGHLWHTIRRPNGTWDAVGNVKTELGLTSAPAAVAAAGDTTVGEAQFAIVTADGHLWHTIRRSNGTWDAAGNVATELGLASTPILVAGDGDGVLGEAQFAISTADGHLWHTIRRPNGTWDAAGNLGTELGLTSTASALAGTGDGVYF